MSKCIYHLLQFATPLIICCMTGCTRGNEPTPQPPIVTDTILIDKAPSYIQNAIRGRWKLHFAKGGFCGTCVQQFTNAYWEFSTNRIRRTYNGTVSTDTTIYWYKERSTYANIDSTFVMKFFDLSGVPWVMSVDGIYKDTLKMHDNAADAFFYHLTRSQ